MAAGPTGAGVPHRGRGRPTKAGAPRCVRRVMMRRLRNCLVGMRAEVYDYGAPELVDLELFLMWRARGMPLESPAVRP